MELLDRMVEILGEEEITRTEFVQLLETGFAKSKVALIPPSMDQVLVGDMERTRLKEIRHCFCRCKRGEYSEKYRLWRNFDPDGQRILCR